MNNISQPPPTPFHQQSTHSHPSTTYTHLLLSLLIQLPKPNENFHLIARKIGKFPHKRRERNSRVGELVRFSEVGRMRLLVSCAHNGSLKEIVCNQGTDTAVQTALQPFHNKSHAVQGAHCNIAQMYNLKSDKLLVARVNGVVELYDCARARVAATLEQSEESLVQPEFDINEFKMMSSITGLLDDSRLEHVFKKSTKRTKIYDTFVSLNRMPGKSDVFLVATKSGLIHIVQLHNDSIEKLFTHEVTAPLDFAQVYDNVNKGKENVVFAYGGEENLVKLVQLTNSDFSELKQIWEAKNVANDRLDMRVPVWPTALKFLNPEASSKIDSDKLNFQFVTISHWSHLSVYKTQHGRRPISQIDLLPKREPLAQLQIIASEDIMTPAGNVKSQNIDSFSFVTTDLKKDILKFNNKGRLIGKFGRGDVMGSSTFIQIVKGKYLLQGGLDRYVRVYDLESTRIIAKIYVTGKVNNVIMIDEDEIVIPQAVDKKKVKEDKKRQRIENETEQDVEELWDDLENRNKKTKA